uniref:Uncharacterized protein n=1 Tax=Oryza rufipogon TaxID=4529 RepID=A0A0E0RBK4_ORYRU
MGEAARQRSGEEDRERCAVGSTHPLTLTELVAPHRETAQAPLCRFGRGLRRRRAKKPPPRRAEKPGLVVAMPRSRAPCREAGIHRRAEKPGLVVTVRRLLCSSSPLQREFEGMRSGGGAQASHRGQGTATRRGRAGVATELLRCSTSAAGRRL